MIVMKFGGSSLADLDELRRVAKIIEARQEQSPVVVLSAFGKTTDVLIQLADKAMIVTEKELIDELNDYFEPRLYRLIPGLVTDHGLQQSCLTEAKRIMQELKNICRGLALIKELTPRSLDTLMSYGELLSQTIMYYALKSRGVKAARVPAQTLIKTDSNFGSAKVDWAVTAQNIAEKLRPVLDSGEIPIVQGFIGSNAEEVTTTLGRGGSDYTAAILGAIGNAENIQIWTDVNGFLSADPRIIPEADIIPVMNIDEAKEMAQFGAKVLHPKTVLPAIEKNIPVHIKNTFHPQHDGTLLTADKGRPGIHGITVLRDLHRLTFEWDNATEKQSVLAFEGLVTGEIFLSARTQTSEVLYTRLRENNEIAASLMSENEISADDRRSLIAIIGEELQTSSAWFTELIQLLEGSDYHIFTGSPQNNRWLIDVDETEVDHLLPKIYNQYFYEKEAEQSIA